MFKRTKSDHEECDYRTILKVEVDQFITIIKETLITKSTKQFWIDNKKSFPFLFKLALRLLSIPATSAHIERFFSVTGIINSKRSTNISDELLIKRSMLKANLKLLENYKH